MKDLEVFEILKRMEADLGHFTQPVTKANALRQLLEIEQKNLLENSFYRIHKSLKDIKNTLNFGKLEMQVALSILILNEFEKTGNWDFEKVFIEDNSKEFETLYEEIKEYLSTIISADINSQIFFEE